MNRFFNLFLVLLLCCISYGQTMFKLEEEEMVNLSKTKDTVFLIKIPKSEILKSDKDFIKRGFSIMSKIEDDKFIVSNVSNLKTDEVYSSHKYINSKGFCSFVLPHISLSVSSYDIIKEILNKYSEVLSIDNHLDSIYRINCHVNTADEVLKIVSEISKLSDVYWCEPNQISEMKTFDNLYYRQYYLKASNPSNFDINIEPAWSIVTGSAGIKVAIIDTGVDLSHEDLDDVILPGYTVGVPTSSGAPVNTNIYNDKSHGTKCAGIIAAINNSIGIRGVASGVKIIPINIFTGLAYNSYYPTIVSNTQIADAIRWAVDNGADVISCSWGGGSESAEINAAISYARMYGRNGKGCVVVFSAGNGYPQVGSVSYPACLIDVIAVGAIDQEGAICHYSQRGSTLNLVAPSNAFYEVGDLTTTTITGTGENGSNYTYCFGGTSAACPQVAGVAALLLSMRPDLTEDEVRTSLYSTAKDFGESGRDDVYGYGLVDAFAAVNALKFDIIGPSVLCDSTVYTINGSFGPFTVSWNIDNYSFAITPSNNQCHVIYSDTLQYDEALLTAVISKNGTAIGTTTKRLVHHGTHFSAELWQSGYITPNGESPSKHLIIGEGYDDEEIDEPVDEEEIPEESEIPFNPSAIQLDDDYEEPDGIDHDWIASVTISCAADIVFKSKRFEGMNVSFSGYRAPISSQRLGADVIRFNMPDEGVDYYIQLNAESPGGCNNFNVRFHVEPLPNDVSGDNDLWIGFVGNLLYVNLQNLVYEEDGMGHVVEPTWNLSMYDVQRSVYHNYGTIHSDTGSIDLSGFSNGIYIVYASYNGHAYSKKFTINR